ncbi:heavy metal-associated isoprenylated plant protein 47-like isoform X2 [Alnus glutinosa]|uniref:heavy metal-associated isoprenylated plant protein 47-like isoform X2 n=1 Tax=Alnus glutinosa TaxID=3517 RepID=UPI002D79F284|nr:heavy metal-associated isoprenylated plant protein 47-like isoform X2 [Alnus glutinosa]
MKQKIVIKVQLSSEKCRAKAMKIAAKADGVSSVAVEGSDRDQLVVGGEGVDPANLTRSLRKKLCPAATLLSVEQVKEKVEKNPEVIISSSQSVPNFSELQACYQVYQAPFPNYYIYEAVDDPCPNICSIM